MANRGVRVIVCGADGQPVPAGSTVVLYRTVGVGGTDASGGFTFLLDEAETDVCVKVQGVPGYAGYLVSPLIPGRDVNLCIGTPAAPTDVELPGLVPDFPPAPTRDQACGVSLHFQGNLVTGIQQPELAPWVGGLPWFEPCLGWFSGGTAAGDRATVYRSKHALGDRHLNLALSGQYHEDGQPYNAIAGVDYSKDLGGFKALLDEVVGAGFIPLVALAGDGQGDGPGYNDPVGMTYGFDWLMGFFPVLVHTLGVNYCETRIVWTPGYDSVFYGWTPQQVAQFGTLFRSLLPNGYLMLEFSIGVCHLGNGEADYQPGGGLCNYDILASEFDWPGTGDGFWQIAHRLLGPAYHRPPDQPAGDDPSPPWYLAPGTARGPYYTVAYERGLYQFVRFQATVADMDQSRSYEQAAGYAYTG